MIGFVYAIGAGHDRIKIGWSGDPLKRLSKIRSDCPDQAHLLGLIPATKNQESEIQLLLRPWRIQREWFWHVGPVIEFVKMLPRQQIQIISSEESGPLREFRERANPPLTLEQLGDFFGVNKSTILRWEEGQIPAERVLSVSEKTGIPPSALRPDLYRRLQKRAAS